MQKYVIAMKSGRAFIVELKDMYVFMEHIQSAIAENSPNTFFYNGGVMFNVNDLSAFYPLSNDIDHHPTTAGWTCACGHRNSDDETVACQRCHLPRP